MTTAVLAVLIASLLPAQPSLFNERVDPSFASALHFQAWTGLPLGSRFISTFGPLGFVYYDFYFPETYFWLLALRACLAAVTAWALAWIGTRATGSQWGSGLLPLASLPCLVSVDSWLITLPLFALIIDALDEDRASARALRAALGVALGIACLVKVTFLVAAVVVLVPMAVYDLRAPRRLPIEGTIAVAVIVLTWLVIGQPLANLPSFLLWSLAEIMPGYSRAMQSRSLDPALACHAATAAVALYAAGVSVLWRRFRKRSLVLHFSLAGILLLLFKSGFVRADIYHIYRAILGFILVAILLGVLDWRRRSARQAVVAVLLVGLLPASLVAHAIAKQVPVWPLPPWRAAGTLTAMPRAVFGSDFRLQFERRAAAIRNRHPLPELRGRVDIYPHDQSVVLAHGLEYHPRPVFQSYMAYTGALARANRSFLQGAEAPEWILFRVATIDGRFPSLDDGLSWPVLLAHYRPIAAHGRYLQLQRRPAPGRWTLAPITKAEGAIGEPIRVPGAGKGPIWARVDLPTAPGGKLVAMLFREPLVHMEIGLDDGTIRRYRFLPDLGREGFVLSPIIDTTERFLRMASATAEGEGLRHVTSIAIQVEPAWMARAYRPDVSFELSRLQFAPWHIRFTGDAGGKTPQSAGSR